MNIRYRIALVALLLLGAGRAAACDFCSCLQGINPFYSSSNSLALHVLFQRSSTSGSSSGLLSGLKTGAAPMPGDRRLYHGGAHAGTAPTSESMITLELAYRHHLSEHLMATLLVPVTRSVHEASTTMTVQGFGDPSVLAHYIVRDPVGNGSTLLMGAGVRLPLAGDDLRDRNGELLDPRMQPGAGAMAALLSGTVTIPVDRWTLAMDAFGSLATANGRGDRFGSSLAATLAASRELVRSNEAGLAVVAMVGLRGETAARDRIAGAVQTASGFTTLHGSLGGELLLGPAHLNLNLLIPAYEARRDGAHERPRLMSGIRLEL